MFSQISKSDFLANYWQQKPLVFSSGFTDAIGVIDGDELAGLACEEAVESRIITGQGLSGPWTCQQGPFADFDYDTLGSHDWTLLVQGVDQWDQHVRALLTAFDFLPRWRLEDIMASFAPTGGGVGPHFDYYDVFLLQASGHRRWQIGQSCNDQSPQQDSSEVRLLKAFEPAESHDLGPGDGIYIPAGLAHWGTSLSDDCVTLSIGFRAPSDREIIDEAMDILAGQLSESNRYRDNRQAIDRDNFKINAAALGYAEQAFERIDALAIRAALAEAFGRLVTDTRHCSFSEDRPAWTPEQVASHVSSSDELCVVHQPHCRMAYTDDRLFVNGSAYRVRADFARNVCHGAILMPLTEAELVCLSDLLNDDMIAFE